MTVASALILLAHAGYAQPQAEAIARYFWRAAHLDTHYSHASPINPCANSRYGEGLVDATKELRGELHRFASLTMQAGAGSRETCIPAETQIAFLKEAFPRHYPTCAKRFDAGDLAAFQRCWGDGASR